MSSTINVGDVAHLTANFSRNGTPVDPGAVTVRIRKPDRTLVTGVPTKTETGQYEYDVAVDQPGPWAFNFTGTGDMAGAEDGTFSVPNPRT